MWTAHADISTFQSPTDKQLMYNKWLGVYIVSCSGKYHEQKHVVSKHHEQKQTDMMHHSKHEEIWKLKFKQWIWKLNAYRLNKGTD